MRILMTAIGMALAAGLLLTTAASAQDRSGGVARPNTSVVAVSRSFGPEISSQSRRPRTRVRIYRNDDDRGVYPSYNPGPNAVRDCTATYVQEFRPSGTVIVPRMNCFWRRG